ncbi:MAG: TraM recognition domain-containing protein [Deferrisomatales bacterium]
MRNGQESGFPQPGTRREGTEPPPPLRPPAVALRERRAEGETPWEASFELELQAVIPEKGTRQPRRKETGDPLLQALALGLGPGQRLELRFCSRGAGREGWPGWSVVGRSCAADEETALAAGEALRATVLGTLESFGRSLRFAARKAPEPSEGGGPEWRTVLLPGGVALGRPRGRRAGFDGGAPCERQRPEDPAVVLSPAPGEAPPNPGLALASALELSAPVEVSLTLETVVLGREEVQALARVYDWLTDGEPKRLGLPLGFGVAVEDPDTLGRLQKALEAWIRSGRGVRLGCRFASEGPVPPGLLAAVGRELYPGSTFETVSARPAAGGHTNVPVAAPGAERILDLRGCLAASIPLPRVLPSPDALLRAGVPKEHVALVGHLPAQGLLLGEVGDGPEARQVRFPSPERSRHAYVIGATGTGKSTLLLRMLVQDMEAGEGVCLIDPHGDLYQQALESVPARRADDVVLLDASDFEFPMGINLLEVGDGPFREVQLNFAVNEMIRIFDRLYDLRQTGGPIFEQYMRGALLLAVENRHPGATLMDVPWLLEDSRYRGFLKSECTNPLIVSFWDQQAERAGGDAALANVVPYITSKLNQFVTNALLRPIIGQPLSTVDFREAMDSQRIVLVNLSKGLLGDLDSRLLGMLVMGKLFAAALGRAAVPARERRPFYLYVDEFQNVTTDTVAHMLSEARKYGLYLTLANQNLSQIHLERGPSLQEAVLGNVGTLIAFRLGPADAEKLQSYTRPQVDALALQELPNFHAAARLMADGAPLRPFVFRTLPPESLPDRAKVRKLVGTSRLCYARSREAVEAAILLRRRKAYAK